MAQESWVRQLEADAERLSLEADAAASRAIIEIRETWLTPEAREHLSSSPTGVALLAWLENALTRADPDQHLIEYYTNIIHSVLFGSSSQ